MSDIWFWEIIGLNVIGGGMLIGSLFALRSMLKGEKKALDTDLQPVEQLQHRSRPQQARPVAKKSLPAGFGTPLIEDGRPPCPKCGGLVWRYGSASGGKQSYRCKDKSCQYRFEVDRKRLAAEAVKSQPDTAKTAKTAGTAKTAHPKTGTHKPGLLSRLKKKEKPVKPPTHIVTQEEISDLRQRRANVGASPS